MIDLEHIRLLLANLLRNLVSFQNVLPNIFQETISKWFSNVFIQNKYFDKNKNKNTYDHKWFLEKQFSVSSEDPQGHVRGTHIESPTSTTEKAESIKREKHGKDEKPAAEGVKGTRHQSVRLPYEMRRILFSALGRTINVMQIQKRKYVLINLHP